MSYLMNIEKENLFTRPINVSQVREVLTKILEDLDPYKHSSEYLRDLYEVVDRVSLSCGVESEIAVEILMSTYYEHTKQKEGSKYKPKIPTVDELREDLHEYSFEVKMTLSNIGVLMNLQDGDIPESDYIRDCDSLADNYMQDYLSNDYLDVDHLIAEVRTNNQIALSIFHSDNYEYLEHTGTSGDMSSFLEAMGRMDKDIDVFTNDCQEVLIPELIAEGYVHSGDKEIIYYPEFISDNVRDGIKRLS